MLLIRIEVNSNSSPRTKSRIRQHGPFFVKCDETDNHISLECGPAILVEAKDGWVGWLPCSEITIPEEGMEING